MNLKILFYNKTLRALFLSNAIVIFFALYEHWNLQNIMLVYVAQNIIIGLVNIVRIIQMDDRSVDAIKIHGKKPIFKHLAKVFFVSFFAIHYGLFNFAYLSFVLNMGPEFGGGQSIRLWPFVLSISVFFVNHIYSYIQNEDKNRIMEKNILQAMFSPYVRIIPMHLAIVFGVFLSSLFGFNIIMMMIFLSLKTTIDITSDYVERNSFLLKPRKIKT